MNPTEIGLLTCLVIAATLVAASEALLLALRHEIGAVTDPTRGGNTLFARVLARSNAALTGVQTIELAIHFSIALLLAASLARRFDVGAVVLGVIGAGIVLLVLAEIARALLSTSLRRASWTLESEKPPLRVTLAAGLALILEPVGRVVDSCVDKIASLLKPRRDRGTPAISTQEVNQILEQASEHGALLHGESKVLLNLIAFGTQPVKSYMTPRTDMDVLDLEWPEDQLLETVRRKRHRRFPVVQGSLDRVLGCVVVKEYSLDAGKGLESHLRPLPFVPESKVAGEVFQEMRVHRNHMALVVDEYGSVEGMVTLGGLVSRLMGEIPDEFTGDSVRILHIADRRYVVDGAVAIEQLNEELGLSLPLKPNATVAGYVFSAIGHLPTAGALVHRDGIRFRVLSVRHNRIVSIELEIA